MREYIDKRKQALSEGSLPYKFSHYIRNAFLGKPCPVCGVIMANYYIDDACGIMKCRRISPSIQHNTPISKGGKNEISNISVICLSCNTSLQDKETDKLNNSDVIQIWGCLCNAE